MKKLITCLLLMAFFFPGMSNAYYTANIKGKILWNITSVADCMSSMTVNTCTGSYTHTVVAYCQPSYAIAVGIRRYDDQTGAFMFENVAGTARGTEGFALLTEGNCEQCPEGQCSSEPIKELNLGPTCSLPR